MKQHFTHTNGKQPLTPAKNRTIQTRESRVSTAKRRGNAPAHNVQTQNFASLRSHGRPASIKSAPKKRPHNYAFIDSQNVNRSVRSQGWTLDWKEFRRHLQMKYNVDKALLFIGFIEGNQPLYDELKQAGFTVVFKPTVEIHGKNGETTVKGNVDTDLVLHAMIEKSRYDGAVIASGDGDFHSLAAHLESQGKLANVMVPSSRRYSTLLNDFEEKIVAMDDSRKELQVH